MIGYKKKGFTLFEFLIYLSLLTMTSVLIALMGTNFFHSTTQVFKATDTCVSLSILSLQIAYDLYRAPTDRNRWEISSEGIGWKGKEYHAWKLQGTKLMRSAGQEVATVADGIDTCSFQLVGGDRVRGVVCTMEKQRVKVVRYVALYEGIFGCTL